MDEEENEMYISYDLLQDKRDHKFPHNPYESFPKSWFYKCIASP
jgi:hypothetical protein